MFSEPPKKGKLDEILEDLLGKPVHIKYVSTAEVENEIAGVLEVVNADLIQIKEILQDQTVWINRHGSILTSVRLLQKKRRKRRKPR